MITTCELVSPALGAGGRQFESARPDQARDANRAYNWHARYLVVPLLNNALHSRPTLLARKLLHCQLQ